MCRKNEGNNKMRVSSKQFAITLWEQAFDSYESLVYVYCTGCVWTQRNEKRIEAGNTSCLHTRVLDYLIFSKKMLQFQLFASHECYQVGNVLGKSSGQNFIECVHLLSIFWREAEFFLAWAKSIIYQTYCVSIGTLYRSLLGFVFFTYFIQRSVKIENYDHDVMISFRIVRM